MKTLAYTEYKWIFIAYRLFKKTNCIQSSIPPNSLLPDCTKTSRSFFCILLHGPKKLRETTCDIFESCALSRVNGINFWCSEFYEFSSYSSFLFEKSLECVFTTLLCGSRTKMFIQVCCSIILYIILLTKIIRE